MTMDIIPLWAFFGLTIALVTGAIEVGRIFGGRICRRSKDEKESTASTFVGTVLGLVAFILAFTFGIVTNRYDDRKALVLEEANAIGTAYLRADFLLETERSKVKELFREYLDIRIEVVQSLDMARIERLLLDSARIQQELWDIAVANSANDPGSEVVARYVDSLNNVLDVHAKRVAVGLQARVPGGIWVILYILVFLGMFGVGYQLGISGSQSRSWMTPILAVSFSLVLLLIASLDRPTNSFITVSQQPLVDLRASMDVPVTTVVTPMEIQTQSVTTLEAKQFAEEAYIFAYSMLENYKTMYSQAVNETLPAFGVTFNHFSHRRQLLDPEFTEVVAPNNAPLYSMACLDLGTEPVVLSLPVFQDDRYYVFQIVDMYAFNVEYIGALTTGYQPGRTLFVGPGWNGALPKVIDGVRKTECRYGVLLGRTTVEGPEELPAVHALQDQYTLTTLHSYSGQQTLEPAVQPNFPAYDPEKATSIEFSESFHFLLGQIEPGPDDLPLCEKYARIGVQRGKAFDPAALALDVCKAVGDGGAIAREKIKEESLKVGRVVDYWTLIAEGLGCRSMAGAKT